MWSKLTLLELVARMEGGWKLSSVSEARPGMVEASVATSANSDHPACSNLEAHWKGGGGNLCAVMQYAQLACAQVHRTVLRRMAIR